MARKYAMIDNSNNLVVDVYDEERQVPSNFYYVEFDDEEIEVLRRQVEWNGSEFIPHTHPEPELTNIQHRRINYPETALQLDMLWHGMDDGVLPKVDSFYDALKAIKDKYPKNW